MKEIPDSVYPMVDAMYDGIASVAGRYSSVDPSHTFCTRERKADA